MNWQKPLENDVIELEEYPAWKEAVKRFQAAGFKDGDTVPHAWFWAAFNLKQPDRRTRLEEADPLRCAFMANMNAFIVAMLDEHQILIRNVHARGYRVVPPGEHMPVTATDYLDDMKKSTRKAVRRSANVRFELMSDQERKTAIDCQAKISRVRGLMKEIPKPF